MRPTKTNTFISALSAAILSGILSASAQNAAPTTPAAPGADNGGRRGNFNPEEFRQRMNDRLKAALKVSDDEWGVIQPLLEKVQTKQRESMGGRFGGFGGGGPGGRGGNREGGTPAAGGTTGAAPAADANRGQRQGGSPESQALRTTLENESSTPDDIKSKLTAVRDARKKSATELASAREDLRKVLTLRQEATLVSMGILE